MTEQPKTLAEKLAAAASDMGPIAKNGHNQKQDYAFQQDSDIKAAVRKVEGKYGFTIVPESVEHLDRWQETTKYGGTWNFYLVRVHFSIRDGKEEIKGAMLGEGSDSGDKAVSKAETSAQKNFYKQLFNISDKDEDPDATDSAPDGGYVVNKSQAAKQPARKPAPAQKATKADYDKAALEATTAVNGQPVLIVQLVAEAENAGNQESAATLKSLKGRDHKIAGYIYKQKLYKNWPN